MQVSDVMTRALVAETRADSLRDAASLMWGRQTGSLLVMDGEELLGIVTERDVMKAVAKGADPEVTRVSTVMTTAVVTVSSTTSVAEAAGRMADRWIRHLPVVDDGRVVGMVSQRDLVKLLVPGGPGDPNR